MGDIRKRHEPRPTKRSPLPIVLLAIVLLVGVGGGVFLLSQEQTPGAKEPGEKLASSSEPSPKPEPGPEAATPVEPPTSEEPGRMWSVEPAFPPGRRGKLGLANSSAAGLSSDRHRGVEVGVEADGALYVRGREVGLERLKEALFLSAEVSRDEEHPNLSSNTPALITADERVRWRVVQYVMQACADPAVRIWKIHLAVSTPEGERTIGIPLPRDVGTRQDTRRQFKIELKRVKGDPCTRVELDGTPLDPEDFDSLGELLAVKSENYPDATAELHAWAWVPLRHVVQAMDRLIAAGIEDVTFIGAPPSKTDTLKDDPALGE